jgi:hypothetical protein
MKCFQGLEIEVLKSSAGFYIGTIDDEGFPYCRLGMEYYYTKLGAFNDLMNLSFTCRYWADEVAACSDGKCLINADMRLVNKGVL